jgi:hypothetical protein
VVTHGEDHFVVMFGGLHIEMAALKTVGDLLEGSGWTGTRKLNSRFFFEGIPCDMHQAGSSSHSHLNNYDEYSKEVVDAMPLDDWTVHRKTCCMSPLRILAYHPAAGACCTDICKRETSSSI